jgi:hypothetical protein
MAVTTHRFRFGATQCVIQVRGDRDAVDPWMADAVVVTDDPRSARWVGGGSGPLTLWGATAPRVLSRMQAVLDERFGPRSNQQPLPSWVFDVLIQPPNDETSTVPVRLVWADGSPDTLTTVPKREPQLQVLVAGAGPDRVATFRLTDERDSEFRWVYEMLRSREGL